MNNKKEKMKVYIVYYANLYEDWKLDKVFSNEEKAKKYLEDKPYIYGYFEVDVE